VNDLEAVASCNPKRVERRVKNRSSVASSVGAPSGGGSGTRSASQSAPRRRRELVVVPVRDAHAAGHLSALHDNWHQRVIHRCGEVVVARSDRVSALDIESRAIGKNVVLAGFQVVKPEPAVAVADSAGDRPRLHFAVDRHGEDV